MDPLTAAEFSRLRKAIQQRDRLLAQGRPAEGVDSNILRALSNLCVYLPSESQLATVRKDWETSDSATRSHITAWIQQNLLNEQVSSKPLPAVPSHATGSFIAPPPPPPLPSNPVSTISQPESHIVSTHNVHHRSQSMPIHTRPIPAQSSPGTPRELFTRAALRPPTPPAKDQPRNPTIRRENTFSGIPQGLGQSSNFRVHNPMSRKYSTSPTSPTHPTPGSSHFPMSQPTSSSHHLPKPPASQGVGATTSPTDPTTQFLSQIAEMSRQQQALLIQLMQMMQKTQAAPGPIATHGQSSYNQQLMENMAKLQAQQAHHNAMLLQQLSQAQQPSGLNSLASAQQQVQEQPNQILSMLQQYQQSTTNFDPSQFLATQDQQSQPIADMIAQMQSSGDPSAGIDWASLAGGSLGGFDVNSLLGTMGSATDLFNSAMGNSGFTFE